MKGKRKRRLALAIVAVMMGGMLPASTMAESQTEGRAGTGVYRVENQNPKFPAETGGLYLDKQLSQLEDNGTGTITLETYVEGNLTQSSKPMDIVLVLDQSGSMDEKIRKSEGSRQQVKKLQVLKEAVTGFVESVETKNQAITDPGQKHRIAIAGFASDRGYGNNTELLTVAGSNSGTGSQKVGKAYGSLSDADYQAALVTAESDLVDKGISALDAEGATRIDLGMEMAEKILESAKGSSADRERVVILFTDGVPTKDSRFDDTVANDAIASSAKLKAEATQVYTIGLGDGFHQEITQENAGKTDQFMRYVSSNYPNARSLQEAGNGSWNGEYFKSAGDAADLEKIFQAISQVMQKIKLDRQSVILDVLSKYVAISSEDAGKIKLYTSDYQGKDQDGQPVFGSRTLAEGVTATLEDNRISVTGFDFEPVIDKDGTASGKKLTVEIPVKVDPETAGRLSGEWVDSNNQGKAISGVYHQGEKIESFNVPHILLPKKTLVIQGEDDSKVYDSSPLTNSGYHYTQGVLTEGDQLTAQVKGSIVDAGTADNVVTHYQILRGELDVTDRYNVVTVPGTLTVSPRPVTLTSATDSKVYDGKPLVNHKVTDTRTGSQEAGFLNGDGAVYQVTGSQQDVGSSDNTFSYQLKEGTKETNYQITKVTGTLTVLKSQELLLITAGSADKVYDGTPLTQSEYTYTEGVLAEGDALVAETEGSVTDAGIGTNRIKGYRILRGEEDVTANYNAAELADGTLSVAKRPVTLTSQSAAKIYDGTPLTNEEVIASQGAGQGFVKGEGAVYQVSGSQTNAGESENSFTYVLEENTKAENYFITLVQGTLKVDPAELLVQADGKSKTFGQENPTLTGTISGFVNGEKAEDVLKGSARYETTAEKNSPVGDYPITASAGTLEAVNGNYVFTFADATLTITQSSVPAEDPKGPDGPKTGDDISLWALGGLALAALMSGVGVLLIRRRNS